MYREIEQQRISPYDSFFNIFRNNDPLEKDYNNFENPNESGLCKEQSLAKSRMKKVLPTETDIHEYLQIVSENEHMQPFAVFLKQYNIESVVPLIEAKQRLIQFYHNKGINMLKLECTLPNLANVCFHKSTESNFYPSTEKDKD